jgi:hypothetical protein
MESSNNTDKEQYLSLLALEESQMSNETVTEDKELQLKQMTKAQKVSRELKSEMDSKKPQVCN